MKKLDRMIYEDVMSSDDIEERIDELEAYKEDDELDTETDMLGLDDADELAVLTAIREEFSGAPDWNYGETVIAARYFRDYAKELAYDCGMVEENASWPNDCIDWDEAAEQLEQDYDEVEVRVAGVQFSYLIRI